MERLILEVTIIYLNISTANDPRHEQMLEIESVVLCEENMEQYSTRTAL